MDQSRQDMLKLAIFKDNFIGQSKVGFAGEEVKSQLTEVEKELSCNLSQVKSYLLFHILSMI